MLRTKLGIPGPSKLKAESLPLSCSPTPKMGPLTPHNCTRVIIPLISGYCPSPTTNDGKFGKVLHLTCATFPDATKKRSWECLFFLETITGVSRYLSKQGKPFVLLTNWKEWQDISIQLKFVSGDRKILFYEVLENVFPQWMERNTLPALMQSK